MRMRPDTLAVSAMPSALDFTAADFVVDLAFAAALGGAGALDFTAGDLVVDLAFAAALAGAVASVTVGGAGPGTACSWPRCPFTTRPCGGTVCPTTTRMTLTIFGTVTRVDIRPCRRRPRS